MAGPGAERRGLAVQDTEWQARRVLAGRGLARRGKERQAGHGLAGPGKARIGRQTNTSCNAPPDSSGSVGIF